MKLFLSRQGNGLYMLTAIPPKRHRVGDTSHDDLYVRAGDPIGYRNMCPASIEMLLPGFAHLEPLETIQVEITASLYEDENPRKLAHHPQQPADGKTRAGSNGQDVSREQACIARRDTRS